MDSFDALSPRGFLPAPDPMLPSRTETLSGWGLHPVETARVFRPEKRSEAAAVLACGGETSYVARGLGRSYGDAALNAGGGVLSGVRLNRLLAFAPETGTLECEAGTTLDEIIRVFLPRGFFPAVTPGTRFVTVGGAIAADVHGKNHHADGTFGRFVEGFTLLLPSGETLACSRGENADAFRATLGGMGLTGVILAARVRLRRVESAWMRVETRRARHLDAALEAFAAEDGCHRYSVAWIDCLARGAKLGRSVLMHGDHAPAREVPPEAGPPLLAPLSAPRPFPARLLSPALGRVGVRAFNAAYYRRPGAAGTRLEPVGRFFHPLDALSGWNRVYGRRGFAQYQMVVPPEGGREALVEVLSRLAASPHPGFLAVLKRFGPAGEGLLSFPMEGYTLAVDLPWAEGLPAFLRGLDRVVLEAGGRVYLAKDAVLDAETFAAMYPRAKAFREVRARLDPCGVIQSSLGRRVGLVAG